MWRGVGGKRGKRRILTPTKQEGTLWGGWEYIRGYTHLPQFTELYSKILHSTAGKLQLDNCFLHREERNRTVAINEYQHLKCENGTKLHLNFHFSMWWQHLNSILLNLSGSLRLKTYVTVCSWNKSRESSYSNQNIETQVQKSFLKHKFPLLP